MKYFYEIKYKNGGINAGHNLENIITQDNIILLNGVDICPTYFGDDYSYWTIKIDMNEIEYLKIEPMIEKVERS